MFFDTVIIGAGPAGLACGIAVQRRGASAVILERNASPGKKLLLSGSGQCNVTHAGPMTDFITHYGGPKKTRFVKPALLAWTNEDAKRFFADIGVPLRTREDGKIFPASQNSRDILNALVNEYKNLGGTLHTDRQVTDVGDAPNSGEYRVTANGAEYRSKNIVFATGGCSYPATGSDGNAFRIVKKFLDGDMVKPKPALTPVYVRRKFFAAIAGLAIENAEIFLYRHEKKIQTKTSDLLFTHHGLSGPAILDLSRGIEVGDAIRVRFCSELWRKTKSEKDFNALFDGKKTLDNGLAPLGLPERLLTFLFDHLSISTAERSVKIAETKQETRQKIFDAVFRGEPFSVTKMGGFSEAMATAGGVAINAVDRRTMRSRRHPQISFCGEILDIDGDTGGYNIHFALASGFLTGQNDTVQRQ